MMSSVQRMSLAKFIHTKRRTARGTTSPSEVGSFADAYAVGHFGLQHGLTPEQAWFAQRLLNRATRGVRFAVVAGVCASGALFGLRGSCRQ